MSTVMQTTETRDHTRSLPATCFPGALPREEIQALKQLDCRLELRWSPRHECWEVWHERFFGRKYIFYRHKSVDGKFLPAHQDLISTIEERAMWTEHGQQRLRKMQDIAKNTTQHQKDPEKPRWKKGEKLYF